MPGSHLHVKPSRTRHVRQFSRNRVEGSYVAAVTGSTWHLRDVRGCYTGRTWQPSSKCHVDPVTDTLRPYLIPQRNVTTRTSSTVPCTIRPNSGLSEDLLLGRQQNVELSLHCPVQRPSAEHFKRELRHIRLR